MNASLRKLTSYSDRIQADMLVAFLEDCGFHVYVTSDDAGGLNILTASSGINIFVEADRLEEAQELLTSQQIPF